MSLLLLFMACKSQEDLQEQSARWALDKGQRQPIALLSDLTAGDLVITEIMHDPVAVVDWRGEWIEVYNAHAEAIDLQGLSVISNGEVGFTVDTELLLQPGDYAVLANYAAASANGGNSEVDYQYSYNDFKLLGSDTIQLSYSGTVFDAVSYDSSYPIEAGTSLITSGLDASLNDSAEGWCLSSSSYGDGDIGTPGAANDSCADGTGLSAGDLVITEIMHDPAAVADWKGEWFEVQNTTDRTIDLNGLSFGGGSASYVGSFTVTETHFLAPAESFVFGVRIADNGGYTPDYLYDYNEMKLFGTGALYISSGGNEIDRVEWDSSWVLSAGASLNLVSGGDASLNDDAGAWCASTTSYGSGDLGTPGAANTDCGFDGDGDGYTVLEDCDDADATSTVVAEDADCDGVLTADDCDDNDAADVALSGDCDQDGFVTADDCDDTDASINPDAEEICDLLDNNCNGLIDDEDETMLSGLWYPDFDSDGYGADSSWAIYSCDDPNEATAYYGSAYVQNNLDCDNFDALVYPDAVEIWYDDVDSDCSGGSDFDQDGDGYDSMLYGGVDCDDTDSAVGSSVNDADCDGVFTVDDCDDTDPVLLAAADDADCDGVLTVDDCDDSDPTDADNAGDCDQDGIPSVEDCDDQNAFVYPGATERCDGLDNDCDGVLPSDEDDADNDGYVECSIDGNGWAGDSAVTGGDDCDDIRYYIHVGAAYNEDPSLCTRDQDGDGWGATAIWAGNDAGSDCDDADSGATSQTLDGDCDGVLTADDCDDTDPDAQALGDSESCTVPVGLLFDTPVDFSHSLSALEVGSVCAYSAQGDDVLPLTSIEFGAEYAIATRPDGDIVMLAMFDPASVEEISFSARSTALSLILMQPWTANIPAADRLLLYENIPSLSSFASVESTVAEAMLSSQAEPLFTTAVMTAIQSIDPASALALIQSNSAQHTGLVQATSSGFHTDRGPLVFIESENSPPTVTVQNTGSSFTYSIGLYPLGAIPGQVAATNRKNLNGVSWFTILSDQLEAILGIDDSVSPLEVEFALQSGDWVLRATNGFESLDTTEGGEAFNHNFILLGSEVLGLASPLLKSAVQGNAECVMAAVETVNLTTDVVSAIQQGDAELFDFIKQAMSDIDQYDSCLTEYSPGRQGFSGVFKKLVSAVNRIEAGIGAVNLAGTFFSAIEYDSVYTYTVGEYASDYSLDLGNGQSMDLVLIPSGADPLGRYTLTNDFYLMTTEVTQGMFNQIMGYPAWDGISQSSNPYGYGNDYPAYYVSWHMAADFANKVTQRHNSVNSTALQECYSCSGSGTTSVSCTEAVNPYQCSGYVLPTDAEWEYAARSGTQYDFWTPNGGGNDSGYYCNENVTIQDGVSNPLLSDYAWYCGRSDDESKEVGQKLPNGFGLYDMHGNLWERTADWWGCSFPQASTDPYCSIAGSSRVIRGGDWYGDPRGTRASYRVYDVFSDYYQSHRGGFIGFRLGLHP